MEYLKKPVLLYAEDDIDDFESLKDAVEQLTNKYRFAHAQNGTEIISMLETEFKEDFPCLIILDINMPVMDGREVLIWIKNEEKYNDIPIIVFTTSSREEDIKFCQNHKCTFFRKPTLYRDLLHIAQTMLDMCNGR
jgi:CheY-like chemotaxis protein